MKVGRLPYALPRITSVAVILLTLRRSRAAGRFNTLPMLVSACLNAAAWPTDDSSQTILVSNLALGLLPSLCLDRVIDVLFRILRHICHRRTPSYRLQAVNGLWGDLCGLDGWRALPGTPGTCTCRFPVQPCACEYALAQQSVSIVL